MKQIKSKIREELEKGNVLCHGLADRISKSQSGGRSLRSIAEKEELFWFYALPNIQGRSRFKVFAKRKTTIKTVIDGGYALTAVGTYIDDNGYKQFQLFQSMTHRLKKDAIKAIKSSVNP